MDSGRAGNASPPNLHHHKGSLDPTNLSWLGEAGDTLQRGFNDPGETQVLLPLPFFCLYNILKE